MGTKCPCEKHMSEKYPKMYLRKNVFPEKRFSVFLSKKIHYSKKYISEKLGKVEKPFWPIIFSSRINIKLLLEMTGINRKNQFSPLWCHNDLIMMS